MDTYLLTWNPDSWPWKDRAADIAACRATGKQRHRWSCGVTRSIPVGSRAFLMQVGRRDRGVIGSGRTVRGAFEDDHWDPVLAAQGKKAFYVEVEFDVLSDRPLIRRSELDSPTYAGVQWSPQASGILIASDAATALEALWRERLQPEEYLARLCWNSKNWTVPTGEAAKLETDSYVTQHQFGHEEWLFDPEGEIDGYRYGFLQPVNDSRTRLAGRTIDIRLYTHAGSGDWFYVGRLRECEVVTDADAATAVEEFKRRGRLTRMADQVRAVGGNPQDLLADPTMVVNVRFRPENAERYEPLVPLKDGDATGRLLRYVLTRVQGDYEVVRQEWPVGGISAPGKQSVWPDDVPEGGEYYEGAVKTQVVNAYERDPRARAACIAKYGRACCVCGMTFETIYGADFASLIHVHHLEPISSRGQVHPIDPVKDLRPVCPNCHAALHYGRPVPRKLEDLKPHIKH